MSTRDYYFRRPGIFTWLSLWLGLCLSSMAGVAWAVTAGELSVELISGGAGLPGPTANAILPIDNNACPYIVSGGNAGPAGPTAGYIAYRVTNTSTRQLVGLDFQLTILDPDGKACLMDDKYDPAGAVGSGGCPYNGAGSTTDTVSKPIGTMAPNDSVVLYFYIQYEFVSKYLDDVNFPNYTSCTQRTIDVDYVISEEVTAVPNSALTLVGTTDHDVAEIADAGAGSGNLAPELGPGNYVGQRIEVAMPYGLPQNVEGIVYWQPSAFEGFDAYCFELIGTEVTNSLVTNPDGIPADLNNTPAQCTLNPDNCRYPPIGLKDVLYSLASGDEDQVCSTCPSIRAFEVTYTFRYRCTGVATTAVAYTNTFSGNPLKYFLDPSVDYILGPADDPQPTDLVITKQVDDISGAVSNDPNAVPIGVNDPNAPLTFTAPSTSNAVQYTVTITNNTVGSFLSDHDNDSGTPRVTRYGGVPFVIKDIIDTPVANLEFDSILTGPAPIGVSEVLSYVASPTNSAKTPTDLTPVSGSLLFESNPPSASRNYLVPAGIVANDADINTAITPGTLTLVYQLNALYDDNGSPTAAPVGIYPNTAFARVERRSKTAPFVDDIVLDPASAEFHIGSGAVYSTISDVSAYRDGSQTVVTWSTGAESGTLGFTLERQAADGVFEPLHEDMLPGLFTAQQGGVYRFVDAMAAPDGTHVYRLTEHDLSGGSMRHGPYSVTVTGSGEAPADGFDATPHAPSVSELARLATMPRTPLISSGSGDVLQVGVAEDGVYRLDFSDLAATTSDWNASDIASAVADGNILMSNQGESVAWWLIEGLEALFFYGEAPEGNLTPENVYWLALGEPGVTAERVAGVTPPVGSSGQMRAVQHYEEDEFAATVVATDPSGDFWHWLGMLAGNASLGSASVQLSVDDPLAEQAVLTVEVVGALADQTHELSVRLNGTLIGVVQWPGMNAMVADLAVPAGLLQDGDNTVDLVAESGGFYVDSFTLEYSRTALLEQQSLLVRGSDARVPNDLIHASGFGDEVPLTLRSVMRVGELQGESVSVLSLSDPRLPRLLESVAVGSDGQTAGYTAAFYTLNEGEHLVVEPGGAREVAFLRADNPSSLSDAQGADYLLIAPASLADATAELATYRRSTGLSTRLAVLEDIFDEFNHGLSDPRAIQTFLNHVHDTWSPVPSYVVLVGNGSFDYQNELGDNLLPPLLTRTPFGLFAADNQLVDFDQDGGPDIPIGRIPAVSPQEMLDYVAKLQRYEQSSGAWTGQVLLAADREDVANGMDFPTDSSQLSGLLSPGYSATQLTLGADVASARQQLQQAINTGTLWMHYTGHGGSDRMSGKGLVLAGDEAVFNNLEQLTVMSTATCLVNRFEVPGFSSLGELLTLDPDGSAISVLGPTGLALYADARKLGEQIFGLAFQSSGDVILGDVLVQALAEGDLGFLPGVYGLMGDPAVRLAR